MNEAEIERELARLIPAAPPEAVLGRLRAAEPGAGKLTRFPLWLPFAAAAVVAIVFALPRREPPKAPAVAGRVETFLPTEVDQYLVGARDLGIVEPEAGHPVRLLHCVWADREFFRSESSASRLEVRRMREQIIPVSLTVN